MYRLVMAIRPEALPTDTAALIEMVLALDAENEKLRVAMQTLKGMIFGKRSERLAAIVAEQIALDLGDLETGVTPPAAANDDAPAAELPGRPARKKARRNIGALPKHLPRCEQVLEPDATACPCCQGQLHKIGEDISEAGRDPGDPAGAAHDPSQIWLPQLHRWRGPGEGAAAPDRERHGLDRARDPRRGLEVRLVSAVVPAGADSGRPGHSSRPRDACRVGEACGLVAQEPL
jgi:hypothetical protein